MHVRAKLTIPILYMYVSPSGIFFMLPFIIRRAFEKMRRKIDELLPIKYVDTKETKNIHVV
jgi:hypothetical protein